MPIIALLFGIFLAILGLQASFVVWLTENALVIGIVLLTIWILYSISIIHSMHSTTGNLLFSLMCGLLHSIPPVFTILTGYQYLLRYLENAISHSDSTWGAIDTFIEIAVVSSVYLFVENKWYKLVIKDCASSMRAFGLTLLQVIINGFFIFAFLNM